MKRVLIVLAVVMVMITGCSKKDASKSLKIGVIQWAQHPALDDSLTGMLQGLEDAGIKDQVDVVVKNANDDASNANMIVSQFVNDDVDLIFAIATPAAQAAMAGVEGTDIPVVFSAVSDAKAAGLVENTEAPEGNITGVSDLPPLEKQLLLMKEMLPELESVGILFNTGEINSQNQIKELKAMNTGITIVDKGVSSANELSDATSQLAKETDALFIVNDNMVAAATGLVVDRAKLEGKAVFMAESGQFDQGILASDSVSYLNLGNQAGLMIKSILVDKVEISTLAVQTAKDTELFVSESVAKELGIEIPSSIQERATMR